MSILAMVVLALTVIATPRYGWRWRLLSPLALSSAVVAAIPHSVWWGAQLRLSGPAHATLVMHSVFLGAMVVDYAIRSVPPRAVQE
jgi:hypothetical protein